MEARGPPDYDDNEEELARLMARAVVRIGSVHNGNGGIFQKWMMGVAGGVVIAAAAGGVVMFGKLEALEVKVDNLQIEIVSCRK